MTANRQTPRLSNKYSVDELSLAKYAADGDEAARRAVVDLLLDRIRTSIRYLFADDRDRDDWVQLAMLEILASLGSFRGESSLRVWADRITVRTAMRHLKQRRSREKKVSLDTSPTWEPDNFYNQEHEKLGMRRLVAQLLGKINPNYRVALVLKLVHGYKVDEIAEMTQTPRDTVKGRLKRGRKKLHELVKADPVLMEWIRSRT